MVIKADSKRKLKKLVQKLDSIRGRGTELITVYCPHDYDLQEIVNQLREEEAEAGNIKSKRTRKNVKSALSKLIDHLKEFPRTPDNGLAAFCGNISEKEGQSDIQLWDVEPPQPIQVKLYRCGKGFKLGPLKDMLKEREEYGLLVLDTDEADLGVLKGKETVPKQHISSLVPGKSKPGGMSAQRFERAREGLLDDYLKNVGEAAKKVFDLEEMKGIIVGGPGPVKERLLDGDYLPAKVQEKVITTKNTSYTGKQGFQELLKRSREELRETELKEEKELVQKFFDKLREDGKVAYGVDQVLRAIELGAAKRVLISENLDEKEVGEEFEAKTEKEPEGDIFDAIKDEAEGVGADAKIISTDTTEGEQLSKMGGLAAFLRFRTE